MTTRIQWWTGMDAAKAQGFAGFRSISDLRKTKLSEVPKRPGVYLVLRVAITLPVFQATSVGGHFKGRNPTVEPALLMNKWIPGATVVYVGKAGGDNRSTLRSRLRLYLNFGEGKPVGHAGGRYIWQIEDCESLLVGWKVIEGEAPIVVERRMLDEFTSACGRLPFANLI